MTIRKIALFAVILLAGNIPASGFSVNELLDVDHLSTMVVHENSVIPDEKLMLAYTHAQRCIPKTLKILNSKEESLNSDKFDINERQAINSCANEMFVLYGDTEYQVISTTLYGVPEVLFESTSIASITSYLDI